MRTRQRLEGGATSQGSAWNPQKLKEASLESMALPHLDFRLLSRLQIINFCCFKPAALWSQLGQPQDTDTPG